MNATYNAIHRRAKALEKDTIRFLANLVRTPSFSSKEEKVIAVVKKEMQKVGPLVKEIQAKYKGDQKAIEYVIESPNWAT